MIKINNVSLSYGDKTVLENISLQFRENKFYGIIGPNGVGKSTLLKSIIGYFQPKTGDIRINNQLISGYSHKELAKLISLIPQTINLQFDYSVREIVLMGRFPYLSYFKSYSKEDFEICDNILKRLDLWKYKDTNFTNLSGGEQQRSIIARTLVQNTPIILLDEAFSHLDLHHQLELAEWLKNINENDNKLIIMVSHQLNLAFEFCSEIIILKDKKVIMNGSPQNIITTEIIQKIYGEKLFVTENPHSKRPNILFSGML
jgi:iron complex transport system ATP-binding protein